MAEAKCSSKRRLFTGTATCSLCNQQHTNLSSPNSWKDEGCQQLALSLDISGQSVVCRPCRNDIARLKKEPRHFPRWEKNRINSCAIPDCNNTFSSKCNIPVTDIVECLTSAREKIPPNLETPPPLCKQHYHVVYNTYRPTQTNCPTCGTWLNKQNTQPCPDVATITYLVEKTVYEGTLREKDKVCFSCYKFHLHILKSNKRTSTDADLKTLIQGIKHSMLEPHVQQNLSVNNAVSRAMSMATVFVGEALLQNEGLLLPDVHNFFIKEHMLLQSSISLRDGY